MFAFAHVQSLAPQAALTATSEPSGGGSSLLLIVLVAAGLVWLISSAGGQAATVVVVEKPAGSFLGFALITLALGVLFFAYLGPATGLI